MPHPISFHLDLLRLAHQVYPQRFIILPTYMSFYLVFSLLPVFFDGLNINSLFNASVSSFSLFMYSRQSIISPRLGNHNHCETIQSLINPDQRKSREA